MLTFIVWRKGKCPNDWDDGDYGQRDFSLECHPLRKGDRIKLFIKLEDNGQRFNCSREYYVTVVEVMTVIDVKDKGLREQVAFIKMWL
ncbi:MAG: hypothetical protein KKD77_22820 [Gammaproteobacteria bacterium]|nr:hypothetical protein [Gammaproteobacteria bacterium]